MKLRKRDIGDQKNTSGRSRPQQNFSTREPQPKNTIPSTLSLSSIRRSKVDKASYLPRARPKLHGRLGDLFRRRGQTSEDQPSNPAASSLSRDAAPVLTSISPVDLQLMGSWDEGGDSVARAPPIGPPNPHFYPTSKTVWSYEVKTESEIYRISTVPNDFLGNSNESNWPRSLKAAHVDYKVVQKAVKTAQSHYIQEPPCGRLEAATYIALKRGIYNALRNEDKAREDFLKIWPSAFGSAGNFGTHIKWNRKLEDDARDIQREALKCYRERATDDHHETLRKGNDWLFEKVDDWKIKPIYAMSPDQYEEMHKRVAEKKVRMRERAAAEDWEIITQPPKTMTLPSLPEPRQGLVPHYSEKEKAMHRLPDDLFDLLIRDEHDGN